MFIYARILFGEDAFQQEADMRLWTVLLKSSTVEAIHV